ncbi:MAG: putative glutamine amidotransferase [Humibacillus sp.]|nr:putative glutamine amidotransferase [Humibacillus sp.]
MTESAHLTVATLFPLATVAAADEANASALVRRGAARGITVDTVTVDRPQAFVEADVYLVGGTGRGGVQALVAALSETDLATRVRDGGAVLFAVDAGLDAVSRSWVDPSGATRGGLGLAPVSSHADHDSTGTVATRPDPDLGLPALVGWEANDLRTELHDGARPLLTLDAGRGNRSSDRGEGVLAGRVLGTRLHGPLLALNPELADLVLALAARRDEPWPDLSSPAVERARHERLTEVLAEAAPSGWRSHLPARIAGLLPSAH